MAKRTKEIVNLIKRVKTKTGLSNRALAKQLGNTSAGQLTLSAKSRPNIADTLVDALRKIDKGQPIRTTVRIPTKVNKLLKKRKRKTVRSLRGKPNIPKSVKKEIKKYDATIKFKKLPPVSNRIKQIRAKAGRLSKRRNKRFERIKAKVTCDTDSFKKYTHSFNFVVDGRNKGTESALLRKAKELHQTIFLDHRPTSAFIVDPKSVRRTKK